MSGLSLGSGLIAAIALSHWLNRRLGGHTGDTYGAVVEWTEVSILVTLGLFSHTQGPP